MTRARVNVPDSPIIALPILTTAVSVNVVTRDCVLCGFALRETTGAAPADVDLIDGADDFGPVLVPFTLDARGSTREWPVGPGLAVQTGLRLKVNSGSVRGVAYVYLPLIGGE